MDSILMAEPSPFGDNEDFESRLNRVRGEEGDTNRHFQRGPRTDSGMALGMRITTELVATIAVGVGIGLLLDNWLETKPWFLIAFILLGSVAGMFNVFRLATGQNRVAGYDNSHEPGETDSPDEGK